ncbi:prepilin-type N-terminal cleavage/methylation domain-containing protein [Metabacillus halosaccharovorans]|uniref:prepilin-type N-terminal cleavage/methylation domain-containing protein n=1 Tax=Metabacillus halosaccharovorans TaxID=930124 RepID=UPI00203CF8FC|nr:prepilin-type N-terminal cleavage/methylation domain-containing protein [Metabacillus halosaccharovorans]MCM3441952.1 prepilin-type N-terminal cleavage/methylation domain-containing protein [Metabacillus halosaccharovorans]
MKNQRGVSLIEVIASISLISIILLLVNSFHLFGQKQMTSQTDEIQNQANIRTALNMITKEIRTAESVSIEDDVLIINLKDKYTLDSNTIMKNNTVFIKNINRFIFAFDDEKKKKINLSIESLPSKEEQPIKVSTSIYLRN